MDDEYTPYELDPEDVTAPDLPSIGRTVASHDHWSPGAVSAWPDDANREPYEAPPEVPPGAGRQTPWPAEASPVSAWAPSPTLAEQPTRPMRRPQSSGYPQWPSDGGRGRGRGRRVSARSGLGALLGVTLALALALIAVSAIAANLTPFTLASQPARGASTRTRTSAEQTPATAAPAKPLPIVTHATPTPTRQPTAAPTTAPTATPTATPAATATVASTPTIAPTPTTSPVVTPSPTMAPSPSPTSSVSPALTPSPAASVTVSPGAQASPTSPTGN
ncbi:MAG TPA: hypothetical protein VF812_18775 [Ktedonobacterales bacterium]